MGFATAILTCFRKSADFSGRARRLEFWSFVVFWIGAAVACVLAFEVPAHPFTAAGAMKLLAAAPVLLVPVALTIPLAAVAVRRLHDINLSGWWLLSAGVPIPVVDVLIVGAQVFCFAKPGTVGDNRYGPDPRVRA